MSYCRKMNAAQWERCRDDEDPDYDAAQHCSDVYVIGTCDDHEGSNWYLECLGCSLVDMTGQFVELYGKKFQAVGSYKAKDQSEMIAHLKKHISIGEHVPPHAFERLQQELEEGQDWP